MPLDALLVQELLCGRNRALGTIDGTLPTSDPNGLYQVGDQVWNLNPTIGAPTYWNCTTAGTTPTWTAGPLVAGDSGIRKVAGSATLAVTDYNLFITAAGTVTLPAPSSALAAHSYVVKATASNVTLTAASGNLDGVASSITLQSEETVRLLTDATSWYSVGKDPNQAVRSPSASSTLSAIDKYCLCGAGGYTLPTVASMAIGYTINVHATASSVTLTPAAGGATINGAAAVTLAASANAQCLCDGTNWFTV